MDQYIGKMLDDRYELLEVIGTGGMAVVYKGRDHRLNRLVAVKILREDLARDAEFRRRFHDESQAVAMLSHPNIMAVYDVSRSGDTEYIVMELIDGITLKQYIQRRGGVLTWKEALHFITQIIKALSHAHSRGIIHRDIKPQNIMVLRDGSIKVTDFGIARLASAVQNTLTQEALGSVHYISPEQARGSRIDGRSDIYSAGVVLYEMLTGRLPFEGDTPVSVAIQHINSLPLPPRELNPDIPEALEKITMRAMAPNVDQRYASADAMLEDLEAFRRDPNVVFDYEPPELLSEEDRSDEPTQVIDTGRRGQRRARPAEQRPHEERRKRPQVEEEEDDRRERRGQGGLSVPLAIASVLVFIAGIGVLLWMVFFSPIFSGGEGKLAVPDVRGQSVEEAQSSEEVTSKGFTIEVGATAASDSVPEGDIISQEPAAQSLVDQTDRVITVTVSAGAAELYMPDVTGDLYDDAWTELKSQNKDLVIRREDEASEEVTAGRVIRTSPTAGSPITAGDTITVYVSSGPDVPKVTLISVVGEQVASARDTLEKEFNVAVTVSYTDSDQPEGTVIRQNPAGGTEVDQGSTVSLQVSNGSRAQEGGGEQTGGENETQPPEEQEPEVHTRTLTITLPSDGDPSDIITIRISGDGIDQTVSHERRVGTVNVDVQGSGQQELRIYFNGEYAHTVNVDFDQ